MDSVGSPAAQSNSGHPDQPAIDPVVEWAPGSASRLIFDVVMVAIGAGYLLLSLGLEIGTDRRPGTGFFPVIAGSLCTSLFFVDAVRQFSILRGDARERSTGTFPFRVWPVLASIGIYLVLGGVLGHLITTALIVFLIIVTLGTRRVGVAAGVSILTATLTDLIFTVLLGVRLPVGLLDIGVSQWT